MRTLNIRYAKTLFLPIGCIFMVFLFVHLVYGAVIINKTTNGTGYELNNSMRNLTNPVLKMEKNPIANLSNPLANLSNPLENLTKH
jgi:hypothetical protein